jgi:hypothetical protein
MFDLTLNRTYRTKIIMESKENKFGFTAFAEAWNGRLAMLGFVIAIATELMTGQGILSQLGLM